MNTVGRADLLWDDEARGLCLRIYGDDFKSFVFVYRFGDRQRFIRIGTSPPWSLEAARARAKELRSILDKGRDPARENREGEIPPPVADLIQYIAENLADDALAFRRDDPRQCFKRGLATFSAVDDRLRGDEASKVTDGIEHSPGHDSLPVFGPAYRLARKISALLGRRAALPPRAPGFQDQ